MTDERARVEEMVPLGPDAWLLTVEAAAVARLARPGQFAMLRSGGAGNRWDPLLRRPLGILQAEPPYLRFFFQVVGRGTQCLAQLRPGDTVDMLAPLGNGFPEPDGRAALLVAGGRGAVPLFFYAWRFAGTASLHLVYGARCGEDLHLLKRFAALPLAGLTPCTDDGSAGRWGLATDVAAEVVASTRFGRFLACGPDAMLAVLQARLRGFDIEGYASLEAHMGCGFGVCHSCAVPATAGGYLKVCNDGPVVKMNEVAWPT
jgi:dihydroorotate dehydrogenase electron transfer subunit